MFIMKLCYDSSDNILGIEFHFNQVKLFRISEITFGKTGSISIFVSLPKIFYEDI